MKKTLNKVVVTLCVISVGFNQNSDRIDEPIEYDNLEDQKEDALQEPVEEPKEQEFYQVDNKENEDDEEKEVYSQEEVPQEEIPQGEVYQDEVHEQELNHEEEFIEEVNYQEDVHDEDILQEENKQDEIPQDDTLQDEIPQDEVYQEEIPQEEIYQEEIPQEEVYQEEIPQEINNQDEVQNLRNELERVKKERDDALQELAQYRADKDKLSLLTEELQGMINQTTSFSETNSISGLDTSLSATPSIQDDDISSIFSITTVSMNPYTQQALQKQLESLQISYQQLQNKDIMNMNTIRNLQAQVNTLTVDLHNKSLRIKDLEEIENTNRYTVESLQNTLSNKDVCINNQKIENNKQIERIQLMQRQLEIIKKEFGEVKQQKIDSKQDYEKKERELNNMVTELTNERNQLLQDKIEKEDEIMKLTQTLLELQKQKQEEEEEKMIHSDSEDSFYSIQDFTQVESESSFAVDTVQVMISKSEDPVVLFLSKKDNEEGLLLLNQRIENILQEVEEKNMEISKQHEQLQLKIEELKRKQEEITVLQGMLSNSEVSLKKEKETVEMQNETIVQLQESISSKDLQISSLNNNELENRKLISSLNSQIKMMEANVTASLKTTQDNDIDIVALQTKVDESTSEILKLTTALEKQRVLYDTLKNDYTQLASINEDKNKEYKELSGKYFELKGNFSKCIQDYKTKLHNAYAKKMELVKQEIAKRNNQITDLQKKYKQAVEIIQSVSHPESITSQSTVYENEIEEMRKEIEKKNKLVACMII